MVKVLDFGLAKALDPATASSGEVTISPVISRRTTLIFERYKPLDSTAWR